MSAANSLIGTAAGDYVGYPGAVALSNDNYVVASSNWGNGVAYAAVGAATWCNGASGIKGVVSTGNSGFVPDP